MTVSRTSLLAMALLLAGPVGASVITTAQAGSNLQTGTSGATASASYSDGTYTYAAKADVTGSYFGFSGTVNAAVNGTCIPSPMLPCSPASIASAITAQVNDQLFITAQSGGGFLQLGYAGSITADFNVGGTFTINGRTYSPVSSSFADQQLIPFTNGVMIPLTLSSNFGGVALTGSNAHLESQSGSVSFGLDPLLVFDRNMQVEPFTYYTSSGVAYRTATGTFVPEPATFLLMALGLGAIGATRFRART